MDHRQLLLLRLDLYDQSLWLHPRGGFRQMMLWGRNKREREKLGSYLRNGLAPSFMGVVRWICVDCERGHARGFTNCPLLYFYPVQKSLSRFGRGLLLSRLIFIEPFTPLRLQHNQPCNSQRVQDGKEKGWGLAKGRKSSSEYDSHHRQCLSV